jgi:hypothetical protein
LAGWKIFTISVLVVSGLAIRGLDQKLAMPTSEQNKHLDSKQEMTSRIIVIEFKLVGQQKNVINLANNTNTCSFS